MECEPVKCLVYFNEHLEICSVDCPWFFIAVKHTTASVIMCENWDKEVRADMTMVMDKVIPEVKTCSLEMFLVPICRSVSNISVFDLESSMLITHTPCQ